MKKFKDWFDQNLLVGPYPKEIINVDFAKIDVVINVSDSYFPQTIDFLKSKNQQIETHWFPMNEAKKDIGLNSIFGALIIMHFAELANKRVYLHCHAGVNRSPTVSAAYYFLRTGSQYDDPKKSGYMNRLIANCHRGYLPPKHEMESFLNALSKKLSWNEIPSLDILKLELINF